MGEAPRDPAQGVYVISVASELSGVPPQTLRLYERRGLLEPDRTTGGARRYSDDDINRLRRITELADAGVNLAGIKLALDMQDEARDLRDEIDRLQRAQDDGSGSPSAAAPPLR